LGHLPGMGIQSIMFAPISLGFIIYTYLLSTRKTILYVALAVIIGEKFKL